MTQIHSLCTKTIIKIYGLPHFHRRTYRIHLNDGYSSEMNNAHWVPFTTSKLVHENLFVLSGTRFNRTFYTLILGQSHHHRVCGHQIYIVWIVTDCLMDRMGCEPKESVSIDKLINFDGDGHATVTVRVNRPLIKNVLFWEKYLLVVTGCSEWHSSLQAGPSVIKRSTFAIMLTALPQHTALFSATSISCRTEILSNVALIRHNPRQT